MQSDDLARPEQRTAQAAFERMMRDEVAPDLRRSGFKGTYRLFKYFSDGFAIGGVSWR